MDSYLFLVGSLGRDVDRSRMIALNVANAATPGFKRWLAQGGDGAGAASSVSGSRDLAPGAAIVSGRGLDVFLPPDVYLALDVEGRQAYSRGGRLEIDKAGRLVTGQGHPLRVDGVGGRLPDDVEIAADGRLLHGGQEFGRLACVVGKDAVLLEDGMYDLADPVELADGAVLIEPGAIEGSNVHLTDEMVEILRTLRHLESVQRVLKHEDALNERLFATLAKF